MYRRFMPSWLIYSNHAVIHHFHFPHPALAVIVSKRNCFSSKDLFWIKSFTCVNGFQLTVPSFHVLTKCFWSKCASYFCARSKSQKYGEENEIHHGKVRFFLD